MENVFAEWLEDNLKLSGQYLGVEEKMDRYHCVIQWKIGSFANLIVDWRQGMGLRKNGLGQKYSLKREDSFGLAREFSPVRSAPSLLDVLSAIISDARYFLDYREDDFIDELYPDDWKKGRKVYRECEQQNQKLKDFFQNLYSRIMDEEDLMQDAKLNIHKNR